MFPETELEPAHRHGNAWWRPGCEASQDRARIGPAWASHRAVQQRNRAREDSDHERGANRCEEVQREWNRCLRQQMKRVEKGTSDWLPQLGLPGPTGNTSDCADAGE